MKNNEKAKGTNHVLIKKADHQSAHHHCEMYNRQASDEVIIGHQ